MGFVPLDRAEDAMATDRLLPYSSAGLVLGIGLAALLLVWRRRLPEDFVGRVKADAALAMLRALLVLIAGLALWLGAAVAGMSASVVVVRWVANALLAIGGVALVARAALYVLRIKPELDHLWVPTSPASPAVAPGEIRIEEAESAKAREADRLRRTDRSL